MMAGPMFIAPVLIQADDILKTGRDPHSARDQAQIQYLEQSIAIADNVFAGVFATRYRSLMETVMNAASNGTDFVLMFRDYGGVSEGCGLVRHDQGPNLFWVPLQYVWDEAQADLGPVAPLPRYKLGAAHVPATEAERVWEVINEELDPMLDGAFYADSCEAPNRGTLTLFLARRGGRLSVHGWRQCGWTMSFRSPKMMFELLREERPWIQESKDRPRSKYRRPSFWE